MRRGSGVSRTLHVCPSYQWSPQECGGPVQPAFSWSKPPLTRRFFGRGKLPCYALPKRIHCQHSHDLRIVQAALNGGVQMKFALTTIVCMLVSFSAWGQTYTGTITGLVSDS